MLAILIREADREPLLSTTYAQRFRAALGGEEEAQGVGSGADGITHWQELGRGRR